MKLTVIKPGPVMFLLRKAGPSLAVLNVKSLVSLCPPTSLGMSLNQATILRSLVVVPTYRLLTEMIWEMGAKMTPVTAGTQKGKNHFPNTYSYD